jgi:hypothetical protein
MTSHDALGPQFLDHAALGNLHAGDFPGAIGDEQALSRFERYSHEDGLRSSHREHGSPLGYLEHLQGQIAAQGGVQEPITVTHYPSGPPRIWDGHHRALAAHRLGMGVPARHYTLDEATRR